MMKEIRRSNVETLSVVRSPLWCFGFRHSSFVILPFLLACAGCAHLPSAPSAGREQEIRAVLDAQVRAWNAGDLPGFMQGYARSDRTRFQSGGDVSLGWQTVFERYQTRYGDRTRMGTLSFSEVEVTVLAPDAALAVGGWRLVRAQDAPSGLFTLLLRRTASGWRIVHDHTSAAESPTTSGEAGGIK